jgi:hypothetical protein
MKFEIGDRFTINHKSLQKIYPYSSKCKEPDKIFVIDSFTKSGLSVYYIDRRTNIKCNCFSCSKRGREILLDGSVRRCIGVSDILLHSKRKQIERNNKLKQLGI